MTKREICERLLNIHNRLFHEYAMADGIEDLDLEAIGKDIGVLILDLAAPDDHFADLGKMMREEERNAPSRGIKEQFLALGEKAIKRIDFGKVADAEWEICSDSRARMDSWARGSIEGAVSKVISGDEEAEFAFGCLDAKASRKHGRLRIELNHRRTNQYVEVEEEEQETK